MKKIKVAFVILHYQAIEMTIKCINSLYKTFDISENFIVVVDNASPNKSGNELKNIYIKYSPEINVIHLEDVSTNTLFSNESKKELWKLKEMLNSISIFIDYKKKSQEN